MLCMSWMLSFGREQSVHAAVSEEGVYVNAVWRVRQRRERLALTGVGVGADTLEAALSAEHNTKNNL